MNEATQMFANFGVILIYDERRTGAAANGLRAVDGDRAAGSSAG